MTILIEYYKSLNKILDDKEIRAVIREYNEWVNNQTESIIDGAYCDAHNEYRPDKPHHVRIAGHCGTSQKPIDLFKVPLTFEQHDKQERYYTYQQIFIDKLPALHDKYIKDSKLMHLHTWVACEKSYRKAK